MGVQCLATVTALHRYPVKSCLGEELREAMVLDGGLEGDRTFAVSLLGQKALTQRECPRLAAISAKITPGGSLQLSAEGLPTLELPGDGGSDGPSAVLSVLGGTARGVDQGDEAAAWVSQATGLDGCRLSRRAEDCPRRAVGYHWADIAPLLLVSEESLAELQRCAGREVQMNRFRPNVVVSGGGQPHVEDTWRRVRVGDVTLEAVGPCGRCGIVEVDQARAARDQSFSVFGALTGYRGQAIFGQYFRPTRPAPIQVGTQVEVLS